MPSVTCLRYALGLWTRKIHFTAPVAFRQSIWNGCEHRSPGERGVTGPSDCARLVISKSQATDTCRSTDGWNGTSRRPQSRDSVLALATGGSDILSRIER